MPTATLPNQIEQATDCAIPSRRFDLARVESAVTSNGPFSVTPLRPNEERKWDAFVEAHCEGSIFHTVAWRDIVSQVFGHNPHYLTARTGPRVTGILPLFLVESFFGGRMLVSVPYAVAGGILAYDEESNRCLWESALRLAQELRCTVIDLRSAVAAVPELPVIQRYVGFSKPLPDHPDDVLGGLPRKARAAARNARDKYGLTVSFEHSDLRTVWNLYCRNMRRLGSIAYPFSFFREICDRLRNSHWVSVVSRYGRPVAALMTLLYRDRVMPYLAGFSEEARECSAANFLYLTLMERAVAEGYRVFDFGRSRIDNRGSCDFKRFQGFEPTPLQYQQWSAAGKTANLSPSNPMFAMGRRIWPKLPLAFTTALGGFLSRHIPG